MAKCTELRWQIFMGVFSDKSAKVGGREARSKRQGARG